MVPCCGITIILRGTVVIVFLEAIGMLFVLVDGWALIIGTLASSIQAY